MDNLFVTLLSELLNQGNNRQAVSDYIRQHDGQTALHALTQPQLENVLQLLQSGQLSIPQPQQRPPPYPATSRRTCAGCGRLLAPRLADR